MSNAKISRNVLANYIGMIGLIIIAFLLSPFLVHNLGDTKYGIWSIAAAFSGYMSLLDFGIGSAVNRYVSKYNALDDSDGTNSVVSTALLLFLVMGLIIFLMSPVLATLIVKTIKFDEALTEVVYLLIIIVSFDVGVFILGNLFKGLFGGFQRYDIINIIQIISALYKALLFYLFLSNGFGLLAMGYISLSANILIAIIFFFVLGKLFPQVKISIRSINKTTASKIYHYSKYSFLAMTANQIIYYSDAFVIGYFLSAASVTYYSIPWSLSEYTKKMCMAVSRTYTPAISEKEALGDYDAIKQLYLSGTKYMIIINNLLSLGVIILGGSLITLWMGPKYKSLCETVLIILFINQFVYGPQLISYSVLKGLSKQKLYSYLSIVVSVVNLLLSIILVQEMGIVGVALGTAVPQILFHGIFVPLYTLKIVRLTLWEYFRKTYLISIVPTVVLGVTLAYIAIYKYPESFIELISFAILSALIYLLFVFGFMLNKSEKSICINLVTRKFKFS